MDTAKLSKKYQIVIPREVREQMGLRIGESVAVYSVDKQRAVLVKHPSNYVQVMKGLGKEMWKKLGGTSRYIRQERASWKKS